MNTRTNTNWGLFDAVMIAEGAIEAPSTEHAIEAWAHLIKTGYAFHLQGWFGRQASRMIDAGLIDRSGNINWELAEEALA